MKKFLNVVFLFVLIMAMAIFASAETFSGECGTDVTWSYSTETKVLDITGSGDMANYYGDTIPWLGHALTIETANIAEGVTSIGNCAFYNCDGLTKVNISSTVTSIGDSAFAGCDALAEIEIPDSVTYIGGKLFLSCDNLVNVKLSSALGDLPISAFEGCSSIEHVELPEGMTSVSVYAFAYCPKLTSLTIPKSMKGISHFTFWGTGALKEVYYGGSAREWKEHEDAFLWNNGILEKVTVYYSASSKHDVIIEVRDKETGKLIPGAKVYVTAPESGKGATYATNKNFLYGHNVYSLQSGATKINACVFPAKSVKVTAPGYQSKTQNVCDYDKNGVINFNLSQVLSEQYIKLEIINLPKNNTLKVGDTHSVKIKYTTKDTITWSSSDEKVATIDQNGNITALEVGKTDITATSSDGRSESVRIYVRSSTILPYEDFMYSFYNSMSSWNWIFNLQNNEQSGEYYIPIERYKQLGLKNTPLRKWNGYCQGMTFTSALFYTGAMQEERYDPNATTTHDLKIPHDNEKLHHAIELFNIFHLKYNIYTTINGIQDEANFVNLVIKELKNGNPVILMLSNNGVAHVVLVYGYETDGKTINTFYLYDCNQGTTYLYFPGNMSYWFETGSYNGSPEVIDDGYRLYAWATIDKLEEAYNKLLNKGTAASLFSLQSEPEYTYIFAPAMDMTVTNSKGQLSTIINGEISGEIEGMRIVLPEMFASEKTYTLIAPADTYTINGTGDDTVTYTFSGNYLSANVSVKASTPVTISSDISTIDISAATDDEYSVKYFAQDNAFDELSINGIAAAELKFTYNVDSIDVNGAKNITANATVSNSAVEVSANAENGKAATVMVADNTIAITVDSSAVTDAVELPMRLQMAAPVASLPSGYYESANVLTFETDSETVIYYTTDGSFPSVDNGMIFSSDVLIDKTVTVNAIATKYGYANSDVVTLEYTLPTVAMPIASLESGEYKGICLTELLADEGATIYYTTNGSDPTYTSEIYDGALVIYEDTTLKTFAVINGCASEVCEYNYTVNETNGCEVVRVSAADYLASVEVVASEDISGILVVKAHDFDGKVIAESTVTVELSENVSKTVLLDLDTTSAKSVSAFICANEEDKTPLSNVFEADVYYTLGDADGDFETSITDVMISLKSMLDGSYERASDMTCNGKLELVDVLRLLKALV